MSPGNLTPSLLCEGATDKFEQMCAHTDTNKYVFKKNTWEQVKPIVGKKAGISPKMAFFQHGNLYLIFYYKLLSLHLPQLCMEEKF